MTQIIANLLATLTLLAGLPAMAQPVKTPHVTVELVSQTTGVSPGGETYVALVQDIQPGWHTYWRNSGTQVPQPRSSGHCPPAGALATSSGRRQRGNRPVL